MGSQLTSRLFFFVFNLFLSTINNLPPKLCCENIISVGLSEKKYENDNGKWKCELFEIFFVEMKELQAEIEILHEREKLWNE